MDNCHTSTVKPTKWVFDYKIVSDDEVATLLLCAAVERLSTEHSLETTSTRRWCCSSTGAPLPSLHSCFQTRHKCWHVQEVGWAGRHVLMRTVIETWWCSWLFACCALLGSHWLINLTCMAFCYRARTPGPGKSGLFTECQGGIVSLP